MFEEDRVERINNHIPLPAYHYIETNYLLDQRCDYFDDKVILNHFLHEGRLKNDQVELILKVASKILKNESNLVHIDSSAYVLGDIHGQFFDLVEILKNFDLKKDKVVFLGDYVDRGVFSLEVYIYLLVLKIKYPFNLYLLRGNHESLAMTSYFTFQEEVKFKQNEKIYSKLIKSFQELPLAAVILKKAFCVHGGISPNLKYLDDINQINRFIEPPLEGLLCDLLWSDPSDLFDNKFRSKFEFNRKRNVSYTYNYKAVVEFLERNNLETIFRGHEVEEEGIKAYKLYKKFPCVYTVFSAPNYCDLYNNLGAFVYFNGESVKIETYEAIDHPYVNKNYIDVISMTFSFLCEKVSEFYYDLLKCLEDQNSSSSKESISESEILSKSSLIFEEGDLQEELLNVERFTKNMIIMREERELSDEVAIESENLDLKNCKTIDDVQVPYKVVQEKDAVNEEVVGIKEDKAVTIEISPSTVNKLTKKVNQLGLENVFENFRVNGTEDEVEIQIEDTENE